MNKELAFAIRDASEHQDEIIELVDAILKLSNHETATAVLLRAYDNAILETEDRWQEAEARADYHYQSREEAVIDYLKTQH